MYEEAGEPVPATAKDVAAWAYRNGLWKPRPADAIDVLAEDLARAWREDYGTHKGQRYRTKHPVRTTKNGKQLFLWADMDTAPRAHMEMAFAQRREQIVGDCVQLKVDVVVYNDRNPDEAPIQPVFDFNNDIEETLLGDDDDEERKAG
jgi:hypothetical protein